MCSARAVAFPFSQPLPGLNRSLLSASVTPSDHLHPCPGNGILRRMAFDPTQLRVLAQKKEDENWRFRTFLKQCDMETDELDKLVGEIARRVQAGIDCTACANCCKEVRPTLSEEDVNRLAPRLKMDRKSFISAYLQPTEPDHENPWRTRATPCPFLQDNRCGVYEDRPANCREYPYLDQADFVFRTMSMIGRASTCPIVFHVLEELKPSVGFRRGKHR